MILRHPGIAQVQSDIHTASVDSNIAFGLTHRNYTEAASNAASLFLASQEPPASQGIRA
jgi:hypothetical protein